MKNSVLWMIASLLTVSCSLSAQQEETFKPNGKPEVRIFTGFSSEVTDGESHNRFDVTRAYLGYIYNFSRSMTGRVTYDVGNPSAGKFQFSGLLKFAYLQYHTDNLTITGGMIPTPQYDYGDKKWGNRYLYKTFHDAYGFGPSADLGISAAWKINPWITADGVALNGEGYKLTEADSAFKLGIGVTLSPAENFSIRGYTDCMKKGTANQRTYELIASYEVQKVGLSAAYSFQKDHSLIAKHDFSGFSLNGFLFVKDDIKLFARVDHVESIKIGNAATSWNLNNDGELYLAGIEFAPAPGIKISPNIYGWQPAREESPFVTVFSLNLDLKL